jgi:TPR repeat protein
MVPCYYYLTFNTQAIEWFQKAAKAGDSNAMYNLGVLYTQGVDGVPENQHLAFNYFSQALNTLFIKSSGSINLTMPFNYRQRS